MRAYNFSTGLPSLPEQVLLEAQSELLDYDKTGMSIMEMSHRGKEYSVVHEETIANIKDLLNIPAGYSILFMTGKPTQFALAPMNYFLQKIKLLTTQILDLGLQRQSRKQTSGGDVNVVADCAKEIPTRVPDISKSNLTSGAAYLHITSNETISGAQWKTFPVTAPLVADMSSDILSKPLDINQFGLIVCRCTKEPQLELL